MFAHREKNRKTEKVENDRKKVRIGSDVATRSAAAAAKDVRCEKFIEINPPTPSKVKKATYLDNFFAPLSPLRCSYI